MKAKLICILTLIVLTSTINADQKSDVLKVYGHIKQSGNYIKANGEVVKVRSLRRKCRGNDCQIIVNNKKLKLLTVYYIKNNQVVQLLTGKVVKMLSDEKLIQSGLQPGKLVGNEPDVLKGITAAHNFYRKKAGVQPLQWSNKIAAYSQEWANYLQRNNRCYMKHRKGRFKVEKYGENLAWASGKKLNSYFVVKQWYDEVKYYNYQKNSCRSVCGHYTQVMWKTSKFVGCAIARCQNSEVWVCNYDPPGNYRGQRPY